METHSFPVPAYLISIWLPIFGSKNTKQGHKLELKYLYACGIMPMKMKMEHENGTLKVARNAVVTTLLSPYYGALLVESYCKQSNISDT